MLVNAQLYSKAGDSGIGVRNIKVLRSGNLEVSCIYENKIFGEVIGRGFVETDKSEFNLKNFYEGMVIFKKDIKKNSWLLDYINR